MTNKYITYVVLGKTDKRGDVLTKKVGADTKFVFIKSKDWKEIDKAIKKEKCLRCGVIKVEENGVRILCAKSS